MSSLEPVKIAAYKEAIKKLMLAALVLSFPPIIVGCILLQNIGYPIGNALSIAILSFSLGGAAVNVQGIARWITVGLSVTGVIFIALLVAILTTSVQKMVEEKVSTELFKQQQKQMDAKKDSN